MKARKFLSLLIIAVMLLPFIPTVVSSAGKSPNINSIKELGGWSTNPRYITVGAYNGYDLKWRVLDVYVSDGTDGNDWGNITAVLVLDDLLKKADGSYEMMAFGNSKSVSWTNSDINIYLNGVFYDEAFSENDTEIIITSPYLNVENDNTYAKVFIPDEFESRSLNNKSVPEPKAEWWL